MFKKFSILFFIVALLGLGHVYYMLTGDFRLANILPEAHVATLTPVPSLTREEHRELQGVLQQPFTYLGHGNQSYAFLSADGKYVLKFFMNEYLLRTSMKHVFPPIPPFRQFMLHQGKNKSQRLHRMLEGYAASYAFDPENSGLLYYHLDQDEPFGKVTLIDGLGFQRKIALDDYIFAVQKKVVVTKKEFQRLLSKGDVEGTKRRIAQLFFLYRAQFEKGLFDRDRNIIDNTGFIENRAIRQDVGKVEKKNGDWGEEVDKILHRLNSWFTDHYPQYAGELIAWMQVNYAAAN